MIYKFVYPDKETALNDLKDLDILNESFKLKEPKDSIVYLGQVVKTPAIYDYENDTLLEEPTYHEGFHVDLFSVNELSFSPYKITPSIIIHNFAQ
jgi:hypothetical protein